MAKKCAARLLYLVVNLFVLTVCLIIITSMLFVAVWMQLAADHEALAMEKQAHPMPLLTPREAAKLLNLPTQTIRDMISRKELPAIKVNGQLRILRSELTKSIPHSELSCAVHRTRRARGYLFGVPQAGRKPVSSPAALRRAASS